MGNFMGPIDGTDPVLTNDSTVQAANYQVTTGPESHAELTQDSRRVSSGTEGDTGQNPIRQTPGWDGSVSTNYVDDGVFHNSPTVGSDYSSGPDDQGQLLRGFVLNGPMVTARVDMEGQAAQKGSMYKPRVSTIADPNPGKAR